MQMFFVETEHGVTIDSVNTLSLAQKIAKGGGEYVFRSVPAKVFSIVAGKKVWH